jgi:hypothetical protein
MITRYSDRISVSCTASIVSEGLLGTGQVMNLGVPGCQIETNLHLKVGQALQLKLMFPSGRPLSITLGFVRWTNGSIVGIEFVRMSEEDQSRLRGIVGYVESRRYGSSSWSEKVMCTGISGA